MNLELRHLRALCVIADTGSITKAAATLGVSQPALTALLQRVEREIGGQVFTRGRHGVRPTSLGQFVLVRARTVLMAMEDLHRTAARQIRPVTDTVRLGGLAGPVSVGLADRLGDHLPDVEVRLHAEYSPRLLWELLQSGRLDAAAMLDYPGFELRPPPTVLWEVIVFEPVFVALWEGHRFAERDEVDLADLADEPMALTPSDGAGWPDCWHLACQQAGFAPRVLYTISDAVPIREMVATRRAISPCQAVFPASDGVVVRPLAGNPITLRHLLVCRRDGPLAEHFDDLVRLAREAYQAYAARRPEYLRWLRRHDDDGLPAIPAFHNADLMDSV
ncbi:LysR family transcriptional regulator [Micromonospora polyrhachis]|uniref:DNA-binding transcriptional LysR family regulator n=1 Tax=Micromonospora polyrhachis TaxID=1282883 RepID=A0A7W7SUW5_9ACTN|nr:LysR family transcriptional regulator [Micromonospora polyrhachis]MBB4960762.1 DNA-binding transcriptional LysR family regulator [Micromonospora polyrhachis]